MLFGFRISIRVLLGGVICTMGILLLCLGLQPMIEGITRYREARALTAVTETSLDLFDTLQALRLERGGLNAALQAPSPIGRARQEVDEYRVGMERAFAKALGMMQHLPVAGASEMAGQLQQAHQRLVDLRPRADAAAEQPQAGREIATVKAWPETADVLLKLLSAATDLVDASIRMHDAKIDALLVVKREAWVARESAGVESQTASIAIASGKPWTTAQVQTYANAVGRQAAAWQAVSEVVTRPDSSPRLKEALAIANAGWFGKDREDRRPVFDALLAGQPPGTTLQAWMGAALRSLGSINQVLVAALADMMAVADSDVTTAFHELIVSSGALVFSLFLTVSGFMIVQTWVCRPILTLTRIMRRLADGDFRVEVPSGRRDDELGAMAMTVATFRDNGLTMQRLEGEAEAQRRDAAAERERAVAEQLQTASAQAAVVEALARSLDRLAQGDLTCTVETRFAPEYERLRTDFNAAIKGLQDVVGDISSHANSLRRGTHEIAASSDELARRTEQAAASLEQTAAALQQITTTVNRTAEGSQKAAQVAVAARSRAEQSGQVIHDTVAAMSAIEGSSVQISQIIGVIDEIAFQTNLLVINAGVEAAHAGEAGRGFAVVAAEVRTLAQRSAEAARQIKALIGRSTQQVACGVGLVGETGAALVSIRADITAISNLVTEIAGSAQQQATGLAEVNTAIGEMDHVTQQNAAMVEETMAATHSLSNETEELRRSTERFRFGPVAA